MVNDEYLKPGDGALHVHFKGQWVPGENIELGEERENEGGNFVCIVPHLSGAETEPLPDPDFINVAGFMGVWVGTTTYLKNQLVRSTQGNAYISLVSPNLNHAPPTDGTDSAYWACIAQAAVYTIDAGGQATIAALLANGWVTAPALTYAAADAPSYTVTISGDYSAIIMAGMKVKLTDSTVKYFRVVKSVYSAPNTTLTLYGGTDYTLSGGAITAPFYSVLATPAGFPLDKNKWKVSLSNTSDYVQTPPTQNQWYNLGTLYIDLPIGVWDVYYAANVYVQVNAVIPGIQVTLSTANNSSTDFEMTQKFESPTATGFLVCGASRKKTITVAAKTRYYLLEMTAISSVTTLGLQGSLATTRIEAICAYS